MMMLDIPCSHRASKGAPFPKKDDSMVLHIKNSFHKLVVDVVVKEETSEEQIDNKYDEYITKKAAQTVRKFCKEKKLKKIIKGIKPISIANETKFANGKPVGFFSSVSQGIHQFQKSKKIIEDTSETSSETASNDERV